jgi:hypothetical protein
MLVQQYLSGLIRFEHPISERKKGETFIISSRFAAAANGIIMPSRVISIASNRSSGQ